MSKPQIMFQDHLFILLSMENPEPTEVVYDSSDGETGLRESVSLIEGNRRGRRGPQNTTMKRFICPTPMVEPGVGPRWQFKCKWPGCETYVLVLNSLTKTLNSNRVRTVFREDNVSSFENQKPQPNLSNLTSHAKSHDWALVEAKVVELTPPTLRNTGVNDASKQIMQEFLLRGKLNPKVVATQDGFIRHFCAWVLEEDLPFTAGAALQILRVSLEAPE
ncbi:MAG TPA: hypothetical protein VGO47_00385 [Chlamydiales bacterium]|jgi:hypothetical protein|nr:hypothetical protein [Chlamydiales bacterium]